MPCYHAFFEDLNIVKITITGSVCPRDFLDLIDALQDDPRYHRTIDEMIWLTCSSFTGFDAARLRNMADLVWGVHLRNDTRKRIALVAPAANARRVATDFAAGFRQGELIRIQVCDDARAAQIFLGACDWRLALGELQT